MGEVGEYSYTPDRRRKVASRAKTRPSPFSQRRAETSLVKKAFEVAANASKVIGTREGITATAVAVASLGAEHVANQISGGEDSKPTTQNTLELLQAPQDHIETKIVSSEPVVNQVFGRMSPEEEKTVQIKLGNMERVVRGNPSYERMVGVVAKNEKIIDDAAQRYGIPPEVVKGLVLIENGGAENLMSYAGARGPAQLMPETAREMDLRVDHEVDERLDPEKAFDAMNHYMANLRNEFSGNLGLAVWGYHAGYGNVYTALREYFIDTQGRDYGDAIVNNAIGWNARKNYQELILDEDYFKKKENDYLKGNKPALKPLTLEKLFSSSRVQAFVSTLDDESGDYPAKAVVASNHFIEEKQSRNAAEWAKLIE